MYAQAQKWDDLTRPRMEVTSKGLKQTPGFSLVEVSRKVYTFISQDHDIANAMTKYAK